MSQEASGSNSRSSLRRHQACRPCRQKKLKCDAAKPHCTTCIQRWKTLISVPAPPGYANPSEPQCSYDAVEGLTLAPEIDLWERVKDLEEQITSLKSGLTGKKASEPPIIKNINDNSVVPDLLPNATPGRISVDAPELRLHTVGKDAATTSMDVDPLTDMLFSGWNPDLPDPATLDHYIDIFFRCDPCGPRVLLRPVFEQSMRLSPTDPGFPHSAILHAICASASRWSGQDVVILPDGKRYDKFAEFHASKTRQHIDKSSASGTHVLAAMQAMTILSWYYYHEGNWSEVWFFASYQIRGGIALRFNHTKTIPPRLNRDASSPSRSEMRELESRRRTWWMGVTFDRLTSFAGLVHAIDERDIGTELPLRSEDYESGVWIPKNPQHLGTEDLFTTHPPQYTDPYLLLLKAVMLFGRVTDFNSRINIRSEGPLSRNQNPFFLDGFEELDRLVCGEFLDNLPPQFKNNGIKHAIEGAPESLDLYMVHIVPHAATINLHNSYINFSDPKNVSASRCVNAARSILTAYYSLTATSLDITRLHPFVPLCWYLAIAVQVQLCRYLIEIDDSEGEATVWGEINALRFAMIQYGQRSPIGVRHERLLQGLMQDVVQMSTQKQPLAVGVPLYPLSYETLYSCNM